MLCIAAILFTVPFARSMQKLVYSTVGKEFFTYTVFFSVCVCLAAALYSLLFKYRAKNVSQYIWLFLCAGVYIYYAATLRKYPEEAIHFIEYGLLAYLLFRALSVRIRDVTVYMTALVLVAVVGAFDEFIQWLTPRRVWDYRDVAFNSIAGLVLLVAIWKAIRPAIISAKVKKYSLKVFAMALTINLLFLGLCLSNTPDMVKRYASAPSALEWLLREETMTEFGYKHTDPEAGIFMSRMTLEEIKKIDTEKGEDNGRILKIRAAADKAGEAIDSYTPYTNPFLFEFSMHAARRDEKLEDAEEAEDPEENIRLNSKAYAENLLLEKYFGNTLRHSGKGWSDERVKEQEEKASLWKKEYTSNVGRVITFIDLKTAWAFILGVIALAWAPVFLSRKGDV